MTPATKVKPVKLAHSQCLSTDVSTWIGKPVQCVACDLVGFVGPDFGLRRMKPHLPQVPQSWCKSCRKLERQIAREQPELSVEEKKALIKSYRESKGYIMPETPKEPTVKPEKPVKTPKAKTPKQPKVSKDGKPVITTDRLAMAALYDSICPNSYHNKTGSALGWVRLFKQIRDKAGAANLVIDKAVLEFSDYTELMAKEEELKNSF